MKKAGLTIIAIFALFMIGLAIAEEEPVWYEISSSKFSLNQSVSGVGLANSYRYLSADPHFFHSHSSEVVLTAMNPQRRFKKM